MAFLSTAHNLQYFSTAQAAYWWRHPPDAFSLTVLTGRL
ncbi:hypothetical protein BN439_2172 [Erwinia amylovora Ea644]|nr:hypothetical protein BN439_2172 [Erwinia amylovora Ea644]